MATSLLEDGATAPTSESAVISQHLQLQSALKILEAHIENNGGISEELANTISTTQQSVDGIEQFLKRTLQPMHYNERRKADSASASKTFHIPELCELILDYTDFEDIMHMSMTCHGLRDIIYASPKLKDRLFFRSPGPIEMADNRVMHTLFDPNHGLYRFDGFRVTFGYEYGRDAYVFRFSDDSQATHHVVRQIGASWRSVQLAYPPIRMMDFRKPDCDCLEYVDEDTYLEESDDGLTLGDLCDTAKISRAEMVKDGHDEEKCKDFEFMFETTYSQEDMRGKYFKDSRYWDAQREDLGQIIAEGIGKGFGISWAIEKLTRCYENLT